MIGASPTRPYCLSVMPPVDVPAARLPALSTATAPTVPNFFSFSMSFSWRAFQRRSVQKYEGSTISRPIFVANNSAPLPTIITCADRSMTARAAVIGLRMIVTPATDPAPRVFPSMIDASNSLRPSWVNTAPLPALKRGLSSRIRMAASTASRLDPPRCRTAWPDRNDCSRAARYSFSRSGVMLPRVIVPAPPWTTSIGVSADATTGTRAIRRLTRRRRIVFVLIFSTLPRHMGRLLAVCAAIAVTVSAQAQGPSADWQTLTTPHFRIHYPKEYAAWTERAASRLESIRAAVTREVGFNPPTVIDVIVSNPIAQPNGSAWPLLDTPRIIFFTEPPGPRDTIGAYTSWIDLLAVHEVAHVIHMLRPSRNPVQHIIESIVPLNRLTLGAPRWVLEGYATVIEGRLTGAGRPSSTLRALILRQWAAHGRLPTYDELDTERRYLGGSMAYLAGSAFLEWLEARTGPDSLRNVWLRMTANERRSFDEAFTGVFGESPERLYGEFIAELTASAVAVNRAAPKAEGALWQETSRGAGEPAVSPDGRKLVIVQRPRQQPAKLVVWSTGAPEEEEKRLAEKLAKIRERDPEDILPVRSKPLTREPIDTYSPLDGGDVTGPRWTRDGRSILFEHRQPDAEGFWHHDLFLWTPEEGSTRRITRIADVSQADPMPDGRSAVAVRTRHGYSQLVIVDLTRGEVLPLTEPSLDLVYSHPRVDQPGRRLAYVVNRSGAWMLIVRDLTTGAESVIEPAAGEVFASPEWIANGELVATILSGGFADLYRI